MLTLSFKQVRQLWLSLAIVYVLLIIHIAYYRFVDQSCMAAQCGVLALSQVMIGVGVIGFSLWLNENRFNRLREFKPFRWLLLFGLVGLVGFGWFLRPEWVYAHMALALSGLLLALYCTFSPGPQRLLRTRLVVLVALVLAVIILVVRIMGLAVSPPIHILDEPWTLGWVVSYLRTGQPSDWIMLSISGNPYYLLPRYYVVVALWMKIVGVGLWEGRLFSLLVALLSIWLTALAARNLYGRLTAIFTALVLLGSSVLIIGLRLRHDIGVTFAIALSLWLYSKAITQNKTHLHFLAGVAVGLGMFAHYHALLLSVSLWIGFYFPPFIIRLRQKQGWLDNGLILFALGAALGGLVVVAMQVLPDLNGFFYFSGPRSPHTLSDFLSSLVYHISQLPMHSKLETGLLIAALVAAILRRRLTDISLVIILVLSFISIAIMADKKYGPFDYYAVPITPIFALLIGSLFSHGWQRRSYLATDFKSLSIVAFLCFMLPQIGYTFYTPLNYALRSGPLRPAAPPAAEWVLEHVPTTKTIAGEHLYFIWLHDYKFASPLTPNYRRPDQVKPGETLEDKWSSLNIDVYIYDPNLPTSGILEPLRQNGYLQTHGYQLVFEDKSGKLPVQVFEKMP